MEELIRRVVDKVGTDEPTARAAVKVVFTFLAKEGPEEDVRALVAEMPEVAEYIDTPGDDDAVTLGGLGGLMGGGVMEILGQLQELGLDLAQVQMLAQEVIRFGRERAGKERLDALIAGIPGLSQFV
ncbi:DUF2267 domain-containing protein [Afifella sp. IM 167]|uniref:DUF2267 domain-containing protein n=1 Tax=Afifella sp. IM 167 TaxID=2033586 RepID=UPI001CCCC336|nr:DUF2267 domain-containing protein [Afifella sp. IM 167]MBZ8133139.1 hypothetical protein [Afifella sp. IM 167]